MMLLLMFLLICNAFGGSFDIKQFANHQKEVLGSPSQVKEKLQVPLHYQEPNNFDSLKDEEKKNEFLDFISRTGSSSIWYYTCRKKRVVIDRTYYKCSLTNSTYTSLDICNANCYRQYDCIQAGCYQVLECEDTDDGQQLCPHGKRECAAECPSPGSYNSTADRCEAPADEGSGECRYETTATGDIYYVGHDSCTWYGITKVVGNGNKLEFYGTDGLINSIIVEGCTFSGSAEYYTSCGDDCSYTSWGLSGVEGAGNELKFYGGKCGKYVGSIQVFNCYFSGGTATGGVDITRVKIENGQIKFYRGYSGNTLIASFGVCMECPIDQGYQIENGICVREPDRVCPYSGRSCLKQDGKYYCSPYDCKETDSGTYWCAEIDIDNVTDNNISMFYCSGDGNWTTSLEGCQEICQYYTCSKDNSSYFGLLNCEQNCRDIGSCEEIEDE